MDRERLKRQIVSDEGVIYQIYNDHLGNPTFGVGHLILRSDPEFGLPAGTAVPKQRVWDVFEYDLQTAIDETRILFGLDFDTWPAAAQEVLVNMVFQMGRTRVSRFVNMIDALKRRDWRSAAAHGRDSLWWREQTRNRAERLMKRLESITQ